MLEQDTPRSTEKAAKSPLRVRSLRLVLLGLSITILVIMLGFLIWAMNPAQPTDRAQQALVAGEGLNIEHSDWLSFQPTDTDVRAGFIIYPGGHVDPRAYAPVARAISREGFAVFIVPMPLNLAVFGYEKAGEVIKANPQIEVWAIGGHSLGGAMAARYAARNPGQVQGLVLWASYPAQADLLNQSTLKIASIYATQDGLATVEDIRNSRGLLPADTLWVEITGGNHAQFGDYGPQSGDGEARIDRTAQQQLVIEATLSILEAVADHGD